MGARETHPEWRLGSKQAEKPVASGIHDEERYSRSRLEWKEELTAKAPLSQAVGMAEGDKENGRLQGGVSGCRTKAGSVLREAGSQEIAARRG